MTMTNEAKTGIIETHRNHEKDTGSPEVQVALLTNRIVELTGHLKSNLKDHSARRGLLRMVSRRTRLLHYVARCDRNRYKALISSLGLRK